VLSWELPARVEVNLRITAYLYNSAGDVEHGHRAGANADGRAAGGNGIKSNGANRDPVRKRATLMLSSSADALLFDLGRVVIDIDFDRAFSRWAGHARCDQKLISERFRHDDTAYKRHERGEIDSEEFFDNLRASLAIDISDAQLLEGWNSILVGEMPGVSELLAKAAGSFPLYAFTNSNREHEQYWSKQFSCLLSNFKEVYVSSTIGLRKPEAEAYDYVVRAIGVSADRIVFFDDSLENIEGARARGLQAVHVKSGADLADALAVLTKPRS
jgi:glucose-1-phosphatase